MFWVLALAGAASVFMFAGRLLSFRRAHVDYGDFLRGVFNLLEKGKAEEALAICDETPSPVARIVATAVRHREGTARALRQAVDTAGRAEVARLERRLAMLAIISQCAPLLGLLGTVLGMSRMLIAYNGAELATRSALLGGALQSLTAAAGGLVVAIGTQVMYGMLHVRLERIVVDLEAAATETLAAIAAQKEKAQ